MGALCRSRLPGQQREKEGLAWNGARWLGLSACSAPENPSSQRQRQRQHGVSPDGPARTELVMQRDASPPASVYVLSSFSIFSLFLPVSCTPFSFSPSQSVRGRSGLLGWIAEVGRGRKSLNPQI